MISIIKLSLLFNSSPPSPKVTRKFSQMPQHSSNPLQGPPARLFTCSLLPAGLMDGKGWGGPPPKSAMMAAPFCMENSFLLMVTCCKRSIQPTPEGTTARGRLVVERIPVGKNTNSSRKEGERCKKERFPSSDGCFFVETSSTKFLQNI